MIKDSLKLKPRVITEDMVTEYLSISEVIKDLEKKKDELKKCILFAYPEGGDVGDYKVCIKEENGRRSFKFDDAKASVSETTWAEVFLPFIKLGETIKKLNIIKIDGCVK